MSPTLLNTVSPKTLLYSASEQNLLMRERTFLSYVWMIKLLQKVYFWKLEWKLFLLLNLLWYSQDEERESLNFKQFYRWLGMILGEGVYRCKLIDLKKYVLLSIKKSSLFAFMHDV